MAKSRREQDKAQRRKTNAAQWAKEQSGGREATSVKLPEGRKFFSLKPGTYNIDFLPYTVGKGNPRADEGFLHFEREYFAHRIPTSNGTRWYCCGQNFLDSKGKRKRCYVCDWLRTKGGTADPKLVKDLRQSTRHLWNVIDRDSKDREVMVFDTNHYNRGQGFGEQIAEAIISDPDYANFAELEGGYTLRLTVKELTFPGGKYNGVVRVDFKPRKEDYDESILEQTICLDECLMETPYDEMERLLDQGEPEESGEKEVPDDEEESEEEEEVPIRKPSGKAPKAGSNGEKLPRAQDFGIKKGSKVTHEEFGLCDVVHVSSDGTSLRLEDADGETHEVVGPEDVTLVEEGKKGKPKPPAKTASPKGKKPPPDEDDEDEPDTEEEEDEDEEGDSDLDEDDDEIEFDEDEDEEPEEEEEAPPPKKKPGRPKK